MIHIDLLKNHPHAIPKLAKIWKEALGEHCSPGAQCHDIEIWMSEWLNSDKLPLAYVALHQANPVGLCSLQENDGIRPDLMPWLGDLCVSPDFQNQGIAKKLIAKVREKALQLGFSELYLFVFEANLLAYYLSLGWKNVATDNYQNQPVTVMRLCLQKMAATDLKHSLASESL